uniref:hypothetical protein n=1 Tax=uncultured Mycobacterium sp. TaxID=171292 RepID=UPI0035CAAE8D
PSAPGNYPHVVTLNASEHNSERSALARLLSFPTTLVADAVPQSWNSESFDLATEFGVPTAVREPADYLKLGFDFHDYDKATRFTWKFLRQATADQVTAQVTRIFEADNKLVNGKILNRLFNPTPGQNEWGHTTYGLWCGDGMTPPPYLGRTFTGSETHYLTSGSTVIDSQDIEQMILKLKKKGYGVQPGSQLLILANQDDGQHMTVWRAGVEYRTGGPLPQFDFIPSAAMPAWLSNETIHGAIPPADYNGLRVWGSYGDAWLIESNYIPTGYVAVVATGGPDSDMNAVGVRSHPNTAYQGLRHIPGHWQNYPLIESFFARGFGVGVRHRGAAVVCQITTNSTYTPPVFET